MFAKGDLCSEDETLFYQSLKSIANLVIIRYFFYLVPTEKEDAQGVGVLAALEKLPKPYVNFEKYDPMHFVFTVMRNAITNHFRTYRNREIVVDPNIFSDVCTSKMFSDATFIEEVKSNYKMLCLRVPLLQQDQTLPFDDAVQRLSFIDEGLIRKAIQLSSQFDLGEDIVDGLTQDSFE
jgi:hypothetical protein